jgi:dienelactone hydrolase
MFRLVLGFAVALCMAASPALAASPAQPPEIPPLEDYGRLPAMAHVTLSPSGQKYAYIQSFKGKQRLVIATTENKLLQSQGLGAVKVRSVRWAGEDHLLLQTSVTVDLGIDFTAAKDELDTVFVFDLAHAKVFSVFISPSQGRVAKTVAGYYGAADIGGHWYGFFGGYSYENSRLKTDADGRLYEDLYKVDLDTGAFALAYSGHEDIRSWLVGPDGAVAARLLYNEHSGAWRLLASAWGGKELARGTEPTGDVEILGFGHSPDALLLEAGGTDHDVVQEIALANGQLKATYDAREVGMPLFDRTSRLWIGETFEVDDAKMSKLFAEKDAGKLRGALKAFPDYIPHLVSYSADFNRMIVSTEGGDDSGSYWIVDIGKHSAEFLGGEYPTVDAAHVGAVRWFDYKAADGLAMRGVLTLPPGRQTKALPLVVMPHGGPEAHDTLGFDYWAQAFASRGYAVWQPNFRGSDGSGNAFRDAGFGQWGRKMQTDISDGVAELAHQGIVDPKRACIVGGSYGGYAALAGVTLQKGLYRCAVSYGGVTDLDGMLNDVVDRTGDGNAATRFWRTFMGARSGWSTGLAELSPLRLADRANAPVMLIYGKDDTVVAPEQSRSMERALRRAGKTVELIAYPGADHWLLEEPSRIAMVKASVEFVIKYNPPDAGPAPTP